ncbi:hypothetical protein IW262DRAFT_1466048 [Armillaria fumosa]|nr:hypothetical protein IW262DRAFT_1466048 [Armillaria fumosa]
MPAQAVRSPSNDATPVKRKGKLSKLWHQDKRGPTDMMGNVTAALSNSESTVLESNNCSTVTSQPLDNARTMTTSGSPDNTNVANTSSGDKTANAVMILGIMQAICEVLNKVPYVKVVTGLASTAIKVIEEVNYEAVSKGRLMLEHGTLKADAIACVKHIDMAINVFQMTMHVNTHLAVEQTCHGVEKILMTIQESSALSSSLNLNVLLCPAPSQYFTGHKVIPHKLLRMLATPVVTLFSTNRDALSAFVHNFDHSSRLAAIFLDGSLVEALKAISHNIKAGNGVHHPLLLILENIDASQLNKYLSYSFDNPILVTSTNQAISCFASAPAHKAFAPLQHVVTIVARGETGKTQMVLRFVSENLHRFVHIWFFDATSDSTLAADFKKLGNTAGIGESVDDVRDFLSRMHENWLMIFDNADDSKVHLGKYIPQCNHGNVIITSCLTEVHQIASSAFHLDFSDLKQSEAVDLILKHAHENMDNANQQLALDIVDKLGCQALAVATAGAYTASTATCTLL